MGKMFKKEVGGAVVVKALRDIVIEKDGMFTYCPTEEMVLADGWVERTVSGTSVIDGETPLDKSKRMKLAELRRYDRSSEVNDCIIVNDGEELHYWAGKTDRDALKGALKDCLSLERTEYRLDLRNLGISLWVSCEELLRMLSVLEVYALDCYNKTTDHEFAINACTTVEEVESYDFKTGYPAVPRFSL